VEVGFNGGRREDGEVGLIGEDGGVGDDGQVGVL